MEAKQLQGDGIFTKIQGGENIEHLVVPGYQRTYSWDDDQIEALTNAIDNCYNLGNKDYRYFMGAILLQKSANNEKVLDVVDGQQRMITLALLGRIIIALGDENNLSVSRRDHPKGKCLADLIDLFYKDDTLKITVQNKDLHRFNRIMKQSDKDSSKEVLTTLREYGCTIPETKVDGRITRNSILLFNYVNKFITEKGSEKLYDLAHILTNIFIFVQIVLDKNEDAYTVFNTMNSLGKSLVFPDIIKNLLTRTNEVLSKKWEELFELDNSSLDDTNFWEEQLTKGTVRSRLEDFFVCYLIAKENDFSIKDIKLRRDSYKKNVLKEGYNNLPTSELDKEWDSIKKHAKLYKDIYTFDGTIDLDRPCYSYLLRLLTYCTSYGALIPAIMICHFNYNEKDQESLYHKLAILILKEALSKGELKLSAMPSSLDNIDSHLENRLAWEDALEQAKTTNTRITKLIRAIEDKIRIEKAIDSKERATTKIDSFINFDNGLSLEHFFPKSKVDEMEYELIESIGNKTILSKKTNSSFGASYPKDKLSEKNKIYFGELYTNALGNEKIDPAFELQPEWTAEKIKAREKAFLSIMTKYF